MQKSDSRHGRQAVSNFTLKCVVCDHKEHRDYLPRGDNNPECPECLGPMILEKVTVNPEKKIKNLRKDTEIGPAIKRFLGTPTFLADIFRDLANDPSWPWNIHNGTIQRSGRSTHLADVWNPNFLDFLAQSPLTMARLALMVVEEKRGALKLKCDNWNCNHAWETHLQSTLINEHINFTHYANVKERVEEAEQTITDTEDKSA